MPKIYSTLTFQRILAVPLMLSAVLEFLVWAAMIEWYIYSMRYVGVSLISVVLLMVVMRLAAYSAKLSCVYARGMMVWARYWFHFGFQFTSGDKMDEWLAKTSSEEIEVLLARYKQEDEDGALAV